MTVERFSSSIRNHTRRSNVRAALARALAPVNMRALAESLEPRMLLASTFNDPLSLPAGTGTHAIAAADFNADGRADLAITNSLDSTVTLFLARPDRQFQPAQTFPVATAPANIVSGDFNDDGRADLAIPCANNTITTLLGQPDGTFLRQDLQGTWNPGIHIFARDMNLDGYDDLITGGYEYMGGYVVHSSNIRYGGANGLTTFTQESGAIEAVADMNNDGRPDLLGGDYYYVAVALGSPDGSYVPGGGINASNWRYELLAGDFNGDGRTDVVAPTDDGLNLFYGSGNGAFVVGACLLPTGITMGGRSGVAADFDRDGEDDVVYTGPGFGFGGGGTQILYGKDMIPTNNPWGQPQAPTEPLDGLYTLAADFNGDGYPDLARISEQGAVVLFNNRSTAPVIQGNEADNNFIVCFDDVAGRVQVFVDTPVSAAPTYDVDQATFRMLSIQGGEGIDTLTVIGSGDGNLSAADGTVSLGNATISLSGIEKQIFELARLAINAADQIRLAPGGNRLLKTASLSFAGEGTLDLADNDLIVSATPEANQTLLAALSNAIKSARGMDGKWLGNGLSSSAAQSNKQTGLAVMLNEKNGKPVMTSFAGQTVGSNDILVKYTWNGDVNLDGVVDAADYFLVDSGFITQAGQYRNGDLNLDGVVDAGDYFLIDSAFIAQSGPLSVTTPEPMALPSILAVRRPANGAEPDGILAQLFSTTPVL